MAPQYGEVRVDYITYTTGVVPNEGNATAYVSGLINNPTFSGNVIIEGDATIDGNLNVSGDINASGVVISGITGLFDAGTEALPSIAFALDPNTGIYNPSANKVGISTNGNERLRVDNTGNVGIGTDDPTRNLVVNKSSGNAFISIRSQDTGSAGLLLGDQTADNRGQISYTNNIDSMQFITAASEVMRINSDGNVGIGTTNPQVPLHVDGLNGASAAGKLSIIHLDGISDNGFNLASAVGEAGANGATIGTIGLYYGTDGSNFNAGLDFIRGSGQQDGYLNFKTSAEDNALFIANLGNVGIGTDNPQTKLQIKADSNDADNYSLTLTNNAVNYGMQFGAYGASNKTFGASAIDYTIEIGGDLILNPTGNVGIGTNSPTESLTVGSVATSNNYVRVNSANNTNAGIKFYSDQSIGKGYITGYRGNGNLFFIQSDNAGTTADRFIINDTGNVGIGTDSPQAKLHAAGSGNQALIVQTTTANTNSAVQLWGNSTLGTALTYLSQTDDFKINHAGSNVLNINTDGNVGIGTDNPLSNLHIKSSTSSSTLRMEDSGTTSTIYLQTLNNDLRAVVNGGERVRIKSNGNVGIGTSNPEARLHISPGNVNTTSIGGRSINYGANLEATSGRSGFLVRVNNDFTDDNDNAGFQWLFPFDSGGDPDYKIYRSATGATLVDKFWVNQAGGGYFASNVGIGTDDPDRDLHIQSSVPGIRLFDTDWNGYHDITDNANGDLLFAVNASSVGSVDSKIRFQIAGSEKVRITSVGNVGIGTTDPNSLLQVGLTGTNAATPTAYIAFGKRYTTSEANWPFIGHGAEADGANYNLGLGARSANGQVRFYTGNASAFTDANIRMAINPGGNVGIGTTNPQVNLHVIGDIRSSNLAGTGNRAVYSAPSGTLTNSSSDATLKTNVVTLTEQTEIVKQLNPVAYNWIDTKNLGEQREIGFIAQELEPLIPEVVGVNSDETLSVDYPKITAVLTKALQEAIAKIETLEQRLSDAGIA